MIAKITWAESPAEQKKRVKGLKYPKPGAKEQKRKKSLKGLRKEVWALMSWFVRLRDKGKCYTCSKVDDPKYMQAGHFVHKDCLDFDNRNIHCQCPRCNKWLRGNLAIYAANLVRDCGPKILEELIQAGYQVKKFNRQELEDIKFNTNLAISALKLEEIKCL